MDVQAEFWANICDRLHAVEKRLDTVNSYEAYDMVKRAIKVHDIINDIDDTGLNNDDVYQWQPGEKKRYIKHLIDELREQTTPAKLARHVIVCGTAPCHLYTLVTRNGIGRDREVTEHAVRTVQDDLPPWIVLEIHVMDDNPNIREIRAVFLSDVHS